MIQSLQSDWRLNDLRAKSRLTRDLGPHGKSMLPTPQTCRAGQLIIESMESYASFEGRVPYLVQTCLE